MWPFGPRAPVVTVIRLHGVIGRIGPLRAGMNLNSLAPVIDRAFSARGLKAVALAVNSPGGSPVQSALIHNRIRALAEEKDVPILVFAEDVAASGGYWLACAGDEIYADPSSILGSIGVVSSGFGFQEAIKKIGVERRVHTAGENKAILDPFRPEDPDDVARLEAVQGDIHDAFKDLVRARRGRRLKGEEAELFSGAFWTGKRALELGLIDGLGDLRSVLRDRFGKKVKIRTVSTPRGLLRRRLGVDRGETAGSPFEWTSAAIAAVEERLSWTRFGL